MCLAAPYTKFVDTVDGKPSITKMLHLPLATDKPISGGLLWNYGESARKLLCHPLLLLQNNSNPTTSIKITFDHNTIGKMFMEIIWKYSDHGDV